MLLSVYNELRHRGEIRTQTEFGEKLGWGRAYTSQVVKGVRTPPRDIEARLIDAFPLANIHALLSEQYPQPHANAIDLGAPGEVLIENRNNSFQQLGEGRWLMFTKLVPKKAHAGYPAGWGNDEYIESLPDHTVIVSELHKGNYRTFEIAGDSGDDGSKYSICDGDFATGRELSRSHWKNKFHLKQYTYWIIVHRIEGILCKMITEHDTEAGTILCVSRNPDRKHYPDLLLNLDDVSEIYNVVQVTKIGKDL